MTDAPEVLPPWFTLELPPGTKFLTVAELLNKTALAIYPHEPGEKRKFFSTRGVNVNPPGRIPLDPSKLNRIPIRPFKREVTRQAHEKSLLEAIEQGRVTLLDPVTFSPIKPLIPSKLSDELVSVEQFIPFARELRIRVEVSASNAGNPSKTESPTPAFDLYPKERTVWKGLVRVLCKAAKIDLADPQEAEREIRRLAELQGEPVWPVKPETIAKKLRASAERPESDDY